MLIYSGSRVSPFNDSKCAGSNKCTSVTKLTKWFFCMTLSSSQSSKVAGKDTVSDAMEQSHGFFAVQNSHPRTVIVEPLEHINW